MITFIFSTRKRYQYFEVLQADASRWTRVFLPFPELVRRLGLPWQELTGPLETAIIGEERRGIEQ